MFIEVSEARYFTGFKILIKFNNGVSKMVDLENKLDGEIFKPLKNIDYFKTFSINFNTIGWDNGADLAPEYLYQIGKKVTQDSL